MLIKVSCGLFFYMLWLTSYRVHPFDRMHLGMGCRFSPRFVPSVNLNETKGDNYERWFFLDRSWKPAKSGRSWKEKWEQKPDYHYGYKQYAFDRYCKQILKCKACNGYRQISRRKKRFTSFGGDCLRPNWLRCFWGCPRRSGKSLWRADSCGWPVNRLLGTSTWTAGRSIPVGKLIGYWRNWWKVKRND